MKRADEIMCDILSSLGILYSNQNDLDKAEECGLEALEIGRRNYDLVTDVRDRGNMDNQLREAIRCLAIVYKRQGRFDEAERLYGEAYNIASKNFTDQDCPEALAAAVEQTENHLMSGDFEKAVRLAEHLCDGSYRNFRDPDSLAKAERTFLLGKVYNANKQYEYAERVLRATLVWFERVYEVNHDMTGECFQKGQLGDKEGEKEGFTVGLKEGTEAQLHTGLPYNRETTIVVPPEHDTGVTAYFMTSTVVLNQYSCQYQSYIVKEDKILP